MKQNKRLTKKAFKEHLNRTIGFSDEGKGKKGRYKATKRKYGDYLYSQDRVMFNVNYEEWLKEQAPLQNNGIE